MMDAFDRFRSQIEDFWSRRATVLDHERSFEVNGCRCRLATNRETALAAVDIAIPQYSRAPLLHPERELVIQLIFADSAGTTDEPPTDLMPLLHYTAAGDWFHMDLGGWGHCVADLRTGIASAAISPILADHPDVLTRCLLNTLLTNYFFRNGFGMLHATGLVQNGRLLLLMAPHNMGKSTTALRLTLSGDYQLLTDSMIFVANTAVGPQLTGFPVGRGKLRRDMLPHFPELKGLLTPEQVRDETKFILDLHRLNSDLVFDEAYYPKEVTWCLLKRNGSEDTTVHEASEDEALEAIFLNSLHYDERAIWEANLARIAPLAEMAKFFHLDVGTNPEGISAVIGELMRRT